MWLQIRLDLLVTLFQMLLLAEDGDLIHLIDYPKTSSIFLIFQIVSFIWSWFIDLLH